MKPTALAVQDNTALARVQAEVERQFQNRRPPFAVTFTDGSLISNAQRAYYRGVVLPLIADETGQDVESLHEEFAIQFLKVGENVDETGRLIYLVLSTNANLPAATMARFIDQVVQFAAQELNLFTPPPGEMDFTPQGDLKTIVAR